MQDPYGQPAEATARAAAAIAARRGAEVVLPATEGTLRALTGREHFFERGTIIGTAPVKALDVAVDKFADQRVGDRPGVRFAADRGGVGR